MGIRQKMNENPALAIGIGAGGVVIAILVLIWALRPPAVSVPEGPMTTQAYYSDDDGKTFFTDDANKIPPYKHNGKDAVRAEVYKCADGPLFVGYLERATAAGRKEAEKTGAAIFEARRPTVGRDPLVEVKRPKDTKWTPMDMENMAKWQEIRNVRCPNGGSAVQQVPSGG